MKKLKELIEKLNTTDECVEIEAKKGSEVGKSILETICSFSNEPNLGGGYILLGVEKEEESTSLFPEYVITGIAQKDLDQIQRDISTQSATVFNRPVRPKVHIETVNSKNVIIVFVNELSPEQKPLYFIKRGLPQGAFRRIGSADHHCTEDDLAVFYQQTDSFDQSIIKDATLDDLSEESIELYRKYRKKVNPSAEELIYSDEDLLRAISAVKKIDNELKITYTGLLTFGSRLGLRRLLPMVRVDYIRIPTNEWIGNTDQRFTTTLDMRGSLLELVQRIINTINDDLPKGFELTDEYIQAKTKGLPYRVLREAVVNALIHRSYRENSPIQIIRYPNRIEITNPGFSLKTEEQLGEPGSINRNPFIASIFHETNLAETKGSGIRFMQRLMKESGMMPPTFESDRLNNKFTIRLLLHHLLSEKDLKWLNNFGKYELNDNQKRILIFVREVGAVDNASARQINGCEPNIANSDLRKLTKAGLLSTKGKNRFAYYIPSKDFEKNYFKHVDNQEISEFEEGSVNSLPTNLIALPTNLNSLPTNLKVLSTKLDGSFDWFASLSKEDLQELSKIKAEIDSLPQRIPDKKILEDLIFRICSFKPFKLSELTILLNKNEKYLYQGYIKDLLQQKRLSYKYPEMPNHPDQAYQSITRKN